MSKAQRQAEIEQGRGRPQNAGPGHVRFRLNGREVSRAEFLRNRQGIPEAGTRVQAPQTDKLFEGQWDHGLGVRLQSRAHRREVMKRPRGQDGSRFADGLVEAV
jgi:hypothetical protein